MQVTTEINCTKCDGSGELECCECGSLRSCPECDGIGVITSIGDFKVPDKHKRKAELEALQADYDKCHTDHEKLCMMNPRAKESYDTQLAATVAKITAAVQSIL